MAEKLRNLKTIKKILPYFIIIKKIFFIFFFAEDKYLQIKSINKLLARPKLLHGNTLLYIYMHCPHLSLDQPRGTRPPAVNNMTYV